MGFQIPGTDEDLGSHNLATGRKFQFWMCFTAWNIQFSCLLGTLWWNYIHGTWNVSSTSARSAWAFLWEAVAPFELSPACDQIVRMTRDHQDQLLSTQLEISWNLPFQSWVSLEPNTTQEYLLGYPSRRLFFFLLPSHHGTVGTVLLTSSLELLLRQKDLLIRAWILWGLTESHPWDKCSSNELAIKPKNIYICIICIYI